MPLMNLGGVSSKPSNYTSWIEVGGRGLDTALMYGVEIQKDVGKAVLNAAIPHSELFVTTKVPCDPYRPELSSGNFATDVQRTFEQLALPRVDLFLMHNACRLKDKTLDVTATVKAYRVLESLLEQGRARAIGVSNFNADDLNALLPHVTVKPAVNQCLFSIGKHDDETQARCNELNITYSAYSPLGGLSSIDVLHDPDVLEVAKGHNKSAAQVALRWVVQQRVVAVTATDQVSHQESDLEIFDFELSEAEMTTLHDIGVTTEERQKLSEATISVFV